VEVIPDGVIDEALRSLCFTSSLVLEDHIIIPPEPVIQGIRMVFNWIEKRLHID
jgi:hypothetical protein